MRTALLLFGCAMVVAWQVPVLLSRLTAQGISARLGLAAWLTAMASALASTILALQFLAQAAVDGWNRLAEVVCQSVAGHTCAPAAYQSAAFELALGSAAGGAALAAAVLGWRYGRGVRRAARQTREHAQTARITGRGLPGDAAAVVLDAPEPAAYCVSGRPATIVLTTAALALLDPGQLAAVLAHERAHLAGRHHVLIALSRGLAVSFPGVPVFTRGYESVRRLAEMCADDAAARRSGRGPVVAALLAMATRTPVPAAALGAATWAVTDRVRRLLDAPGPARRAWCRAGLTALTLLVAALPAAVAVLPG